MIKDILLGDRNFVGNLAAMMDIPASQIIDVGMKELDRMLTVHDVLSFHEAWILCGVLGFKAVATGGDE